MRLSDHFTLGELVRSQLAARRGIDNRPCARDVENLKRLCEGVLEPVRAHFRMPFSPSSGYRSPALNRTLGGSARSQHMRGEAADFGIPGVSNIALAQWIRDSLDFDQLILEYPDADDPHAGWVHCSVTAAGNRGEVLTCTRDGTAPGLIGQYNRNG